MFDSIYTISYMGPINQDSSSRDLNNTWMNRGLKDQRIFTKIIYNMLLSLGKAFSSIGDSLQSHYQNQKDNGD